MVSFISLSILGDVAKSRRGVGGTGLVGNRISTAEGLLRTSLKQPLTVEIVEGLQLVAQEILDVDDLLQHPYPIESGTCLKHMEYPKDRFEGVDRTDCPLKLFPRVLFMRSVRSFWGTAVIFPAISSNLFSLF